VKAAPVSLRSSWAIPLVLLILLALFPLAVNFGAQGYWVSMMTRVMIFAIAALSLDLILGIGGLVSFGHAAFFGIGAYAAGILLHHGKGDLLVAIPVALAMSGLYALITGAISLRTKGVAFIMITLAFGQMVFFLAQSLYAYGGDDGLTLASRSTVAGYPILKNRMVMFYLVLAMLAGTYMLCRSLVASRFGRALLAARDNAVRTSSLGFDVLRIRLTAYVIAGMIAGLAGVLMANNTEFVSPSYMAWQRSGELIFMVILGGVGSLWGAVVGAATFLLIEEVLSGLTPDWKVIFGPLIIAFVLFTRGGMAGLINRITGKTRITGRPHG
jgi:branched-chain amino acid transport system permease protein